MPPPVSIPVDIDIFPPPVYEVVEIIETYPQDQNWGYTGESFNRWKVGYVANITSYGVGAHLMIPAGVQANSEFFIRLGAVLFSKSPEFIINGNSYEPQSGLLPLALMVKTTHYSAQNSYGEYHVYSLVGGGPVFGIAVPMNFDESSSGGYTQLGLAGELFGAIGTEFVLNNSVGYYVEVGLSYLNFAGRSFSTEQHFLSPTLSLGIRFY